LLRRICKALGLTPEQVSRRNGTPASTGDCGVFPFLYQGGGLLHRFARVPIDFRFRWWQHSSSRTANRERTHPMSIESHLSELARKHEALEREIEAERTHPGGDSLKLAELKRRKLSLKDEIARLREDTLH
jgi:hypothetical protein